MSDILRLIPFLLIVFLCSVSNAQNEDAVIILKMDDVRDNSGGTYRPSWQRYADSVRSYDVNSGMGLVATDLVGATDQFKDSLKSWHASEYFEIWHHGWDHQRNIYTTGDYEFRNTPYDHQKNHFEDGMIYALSELGIVLRTFGAPYNQTDATFSQVIGENHDMKVWLYCNDDDYAGMCLERGSSNQLESSTGVVSYNSFLTAYTSNTNPYLVLQGHPGNWDDDSFVEFDQVIAFLKSKGHRFVLPYDYYLEEFGPSQFVFEDNFNDQSAKYFGENSDSFVLQANSACGQVILAPIPDQSLPQEQPLIYQIRPQDENTSVEVKGDVRVFLRVKSEQSLDIRLDLSDGANSTSGMAGKLTSQVVSGLDDWQLLQFDFTQSSFTDTGVDTTRISEIHLFPSPSNDGFSGKLIIDYVSIGEARINNRDCIDYFENGTSGTLFTEAFDDMNLNVLHGGNKYLLEENDCGELVVDLADNQIITQGDYLRINMSEPIDVAQNPQITVRLKSETPLRMRVDFYDGVNATSGIGYGRQTKEVEGDKEKWTEVTFDFDYFSFFEGGVDYQGIVSVDLYPNPEDRRLISPILIDYVVVGDAAMDNDECPPIVTALDQGHSSFEIYPNPAQGAVYVRQSGVRNYRLEIFDVSGRKVKSVKGSGDSLKLDVSRLEAGLHFVKISPASGDKSVLRLIIR